MTNRQEQPGYTPEGLQQVIASHWGFRTLRPLQDAAMRAVLDGRSGSSENGERGGR
jgi:hypothetical protein